MKTVATLSLLLLLAACQNGRSQPLDQGRTEADSPSANLGKYYSPSLTPEELGVNQEGTVVVTITPGSGFKWNDEYPAKFALTAPTEVVLGKADFAFQKKEVEVNAQGARLSVPLTVKAAGSFKVQVKGNFSVCNDTSCKIMRDEQFSVALQGR